MSEPYEEDLDMYEEAAGSAPKRLDNRVLLRPISTLKYPEHPVSVSPGTAVGAVLEGMVSIRIGAVLVVDGGRVVGIFSERDALLKGVYRAEAMKRPVREFMTPDPQCLTPHDSIAMALNRMAEGGYRHVPLVDAGGAPVGMLVMRDVVRYVVSFFPAEVLNVPPHSEHAPPDRDLHGG